MKILQIAVGENLTGGGVGRIATNLADEFAKYTESHLASCFQYSDPAFSRKYYFHKIKCSRFPFFSSVVFPFDLERIIKEVSPDLIVSHGYASSLPLFAYDIASRHKIKHVFAVHSYPRETGARKFAMAIYDVLAKRALKNSKIIYFSESSKSYLKYKGEVFNFIPEKIFFEQKKRKPEYLLFVGRLDENKRPEMFVRICASLGMKGFIAGIDEGLGNKTITLAKKLGVDIKIEEVPFNKMPEVYSKAYALINTSKYEGLPLTWLEAIASSVPVFTTNTGDAEIILERFYGKKDEFLFSSVEEASDKIPKFLNNPEARNLAELAKKKLQENDWNKVSKRIFDYISNHQEDG